ncbi:MAG: hypothetical protein ABS913_05470 [Desemzia incerta]|uniref:hypothetical protein n=1 Tax=Desemzia incerta TaxID=82801 RepID=UPI003315EBC2
MIINLNENIFFEIKEYYLSQIITPVKEQYKAERAKDPKNILFDYLKEENLKEIIVGKIYDNKVWKFIDNYRKTMCLAYLDINNNGHVQTTWKYIKENNIPLFSSTQKNEQYIELRRYLFSKYNNTLVQDALGQNIDYTNSFNSFKVMQNHIKDYFYEMNQILEKIFDYNFIKKAGLRSEILSSTKINICPYCNRQFINSYEVKESLRVSAHLDHFYPKSKFPLFALSLYNFIPSCAHCNSILKRDKVLDFVYPINNKNNMEKVFFEVSCNNYRQLVGLEEPQIKIKKNNITNFDEAFSRNFIELFRIESIYEFHKDFVKNLKLKENMLEDNYKDWLESILKINISYSSYYYLIFGYEYNEEELFNRPLSKLVHDTVFNA